MRPAYNEAATQTARARTTIGDRSIIMTNISTFSDSDAYELQMGRWSRRLGEPFLDFIGTVDGERVLDVGCGTGSLAFAIARRSNVKAVCGIDSTTAFIDSATNKNSDPRIEFRVGDAGALPFRDGTFDKVFHFSSYISCRKPSWPSKKCAALPDRGPLLVRRY